MAAVVAFDGQCEDLEVPLDVVDMEESAAAEAEAMMEAQAQAAAPIDTLQGDIGGDSCCLPYAAPSLPPEAAAGGLPGRISALNSKASGPGLRGPSRRPGGRREKALPLS